jgi:MFS family permease
LTRAIDLFRLEPRARIFFLALTQSALGTGAGYIALLLIAYERFNSPWAVSLILIADLIPAMLLGPVFGAAADRWSRRTCLVVADLIRAVAFAAIAVVDSFAATLALSALVGIGTGVFTPASLAALPSLVEPKRLPAATSVYGAIADIGFTAGPAIAAVTLLLGGPSTIIVANAATFLVSAVLLYRLRFGAAPTKDDAAVGSRSLLREAKEGLGALSEMRGIRVVILASAAGLFFGGLFNVAELLFATGELGAEASGFSVLAALYGVGFVGGSLAGAVGGDDREQRRRFLLGLFVMGVGFLGSGLAPVFWTALVTFAVAGFGNGLLLVYERLLIQTHVPDALMARIFGAKDALTAWAFAMAFVSAGAIISAIGTRPLLIGAGAGTLTACFIGWAALSRRSPVPAPLATALVDDAGASRHRATGQDGPDLIDGRDHWLAILDDLRGGGDDRRVELHSGVRD